MLLPRTVFLAVVVLLAPGVLRAGTEFYVAPLVRSDQLHLFAPVSANGGPPVSWLLDTGAPISLISQSLSQKLNLAGAVVPAIKSGARNGSRPVAVLQSIKVNGAELGPARVIQDPMSAFSTEKLIAGHGPLEKGGLLGNDLLIRRGAVINSQTQQIFFAADGGRLPLPRSGYEKMGLHYVPMRVTGRRYLEIEGSIAGKTYSFILDTGAYITILQARIQRELHLPVQSTRAVLTGPYAKIEKVRLTQSQVPGFNIGGVDLSHSVTGFAEIGNLQPDTAHEFAGLIGPDLLFFHQSLIDIGNRAFYLREDLRARKK